MAMSIIEFLRQLFSDDDLREQFVDDPQGTLDDAGLHNVSADDLHDAITLLNDSEDGHGGGHHVAAPHPVHHGGGHEQSSVEYLRTYITNNYTVDDRDIDNSVNQHIDTDGGNFDQDISNVSNAGDGAVVAGDDIDDSTITTGDDNQVGNGNIRADGDGNVIGDRNAAVTGNDNTTSFGQGDAIGGGISVDDGGAYSGHGNAHADNDTTVTTNDNHSVVDNDTTNTVEDSYNTESSYDSDTTTDSHNHSDVDSHNSAEFHAS